MPRNPTTGVFTRVSNSFSDPVEGTVIDPADAILYYNDMDGGITDSIAAVVTPTDNAVARFDGVTGKFIQNSSATLDNSGNLSTPGTVETLGYFIENNSTDHAYILRARTLGALSFPVPSFQPTKANSPLAVDLMPSGPVPVESSGNGFTWIDMCDADILTSNVNPVNCARVAMTSTGAQFGCFNFNGAVAKPIEFCVGSGGGTAIKGRIGTTGILTMGAGADTPTFTAGPYIGNFAGDTGWTMRNSTNHTELFGLASATAVYMGAATNHPLVIRVNNVDQATFNTSQNLAGLASITRTGGVSVEGTNTNDNAAAGRYGEYVTSSVLVGSALALTTGTPLNVTSISLTAGDWMVTAQSYILLAATTNMTNFQYSISATSATLDFTPGRWNTVQNAAAGIVYGNVNLTYGALTSRVSLTSTTTIYLVSQAAFTISTASTWGTISARRAR